MAVLANKIGELRLVRFEPNQPEGVTIQERENAPLVLLLNRLLAPALDVRLGEFNGDDIRRDVQYELRKVGEAVAVNSIVRLVQRGKYNDLWKGVGRVAGSR
jgi:hypothetical protein